MVFFDIYYRTTFSIWRLRSSTKATEQHGSMFCTTSPQSTNYISGMIVAVAMKNWNVKFFNSMEMTLHVVWCKHPLISVDKCKVGCRSVAFERRIGRISIHINEDGEREKIFDMCLASFPVRKP